MLDLKEIQERVERREYDPKDLDLAMREAASRMSYKTYTGEKSKGPTELELAFQQHADDVRTLMAFDLMDRARANAEIHAERGLMLLQEAIEWSSCRESSIRLMQECKNELIRADAAVHQVHSYVGFSSDITAAYKQALIHTQPILDWIMPILIQIELWECGMQNKIGIRA